MLVVERKPESGLYIGDDIKVKVLKVTGASVKLGVCAPRSISILREELPRTGYPTPEVSRHQAPAREETTTGPPIRVLAVEDNPIHSRMIHKALSETNLAQLDMVESGEQAIDRFNRRGHGPAAHPDLILLDLNLPGMSGLELLSMLKSIDALKRIPVVILSSSEQERDVNCCLEAGASAFISKTQKYADFKQSIYRIADFWSHTRRVA